MRSSAIFIKNKKREPLTIAEIGVENGDNALSMLDNMSISHLYLVDCYLSYADYLTSLTSQQEQNSRYFKMFFQLKKYFDRATLVTRFSSFASTLFSNSFFDYVYIDANHDYQNVKQDINLWWSKVKEGGVLGGHDFDQTAVHNVSKAVREFVLEKNLKLLLFNDSDWCIEK